MSATPKKATAAAAGEVDKKNRHGLTENELRIATACLLSLKDGDFAVDKDKLAYHGGYSTPESARVSTGPIIKKLKALMADNGDGTAPAPATPKAKATPKRKAKKDDDGEASATPKKRARKAAKKQEVKEVIEVEEQAADQSEDEGHDLVLQSELEI
ncbi:uncharacterized protein E0L32_002841 [Thyridium curvatum]|uniref:Uncharacterized protein n=1 Tax=Thyridium curvatum TaxID=1093900 RepID=A0A507BLZ5_9PEZI|nr:uncharacterized protein E0L32_002841 [Thyridium curvatum]TPX17740.1 hypothetical protein E0L32_002841 [Thyridium curvatum]